MFDVGFQEIIVILVIALIVLGPSRLPQAGLTLGRALRNVKRASNELVTALREPLDNLAEDEGKERL